MKLTVVIPCYNEVNTIVEVVKLIKSGPIKNGEIIAVDDLSSDDIINKLITTLSNMFTHIDLTDIRLLQNIPPRNYSVYQNRGKALWLRAGNNGENN